MKLSLYWQDLPRTVYPIVYPMSRTFQKILMKKRSFLEFGGLWSCRRVVIPKFSRVIIYFFGIYHLLKIVGGQFVQKTPVERTIFLELACWKRWMGGKFPRNSVYGMEILESVDARTISMAPIAEDNARPWLAPPLTSFASLSYFPANRCALWENTHGTLLVPFLYQKIKTRPSDVFLFSGGGHGTRIGFDDVLVCFEMSINVEIPMFTR